VRRRAILSRSSTQAALGSTAARYGAQHPYETLGVSVDATAREVRRAYLRLSQLLHPDKNEPALAVDAAAAFADLSTAYELLSDQAQREAFDGAGADGQAFFHDEASFRASGRDFASDLFARQKTLITELSEATFPRLVAGERVWLLNFYTPWCSHCQACVPLYLQLAEELAEAGVDVGAINCHKHAALCSSFDVRSYPSIRMASGALGLHQDGHAVSTAGLPAIVAWALSVLDEWRWLFSHARLAELDAPVFAARVLDDPTQLWIILFLDGEDCGPCRVARSNLARLSAGLAKLSNVSVGVLDCDEEEADKLCAELALPQPPFAPTVRVFRRGRRASDHGQELYDPNEIEPHVALKLTQQLLLLALSSNDDDETVGDYQKENSEKEQPPPPPPRPPPQWNGAQRRAAAGQLGGAPPSGPPSMGFIR
jgi:thiol-disulfide isomerase/thioredoxin